MLERGPRPSRLQIGWLVAFVVCNAAAAAALAQATDATRAAQGHELTVANPTAEQTIAPQPVVSQGQTFVQIEVAQIDNPNHVPLSLSVEVETPQTGKIYLGSVRLDSATSSDRFLLATQGTLRAGGTLRVTLLPLRNVSDGEGIQLRLRPFSLTRR